MSNKEKYEPHIIFSKDFYDNAAEWRAHLKDLERYEKTKQIRDKIEFAKEQIEKSEAREEFNEWRKKNAPEYCLPHLNYLSPLDDWRKFLAKLESQPPSRGIAWGLELVRDHIAEEEGRARRRVEGEAAGNSAQDERGNEDEKA